jgi:acyl dehydratase
MSADYISELMTGVFGQGWLTGGKLSLAFVKPALCGDALTANGRLIDRADEGAYIRDMYEVWCENQRGELVTVGTASGLLLAAGER